ncbi:MAG: c(7)-type cytochrome triheme domain-containing protein [Dissulfurispiraceae bacterium]
MWQWFKKLEEQLRNFIVQHTKLTILIILALIGFFIFISVEALHFSSDPEFCKNCHPSDKPGPLGEVITWTKSIHARAGVKCLDCHAEPGFWGYMRAKMGGLYDVYGEFIKGPEHKMHVLMSTSDPKYAAQLVKNDICLFCHSDAMNQKIRSSRIMSLGVSFRLVDSVKNPEFRQQWGLPDITVDPVRSTANVDPNHKKHIAMGINCVVCHAKITHSGITGYRSNMKICYGCHDQQRSTNLNPPADTNCLGCHRNRESLYPRGPITFGTGESAVNYEHVVHVAVFGCNTCHMAGYSPTNWLLATPKNVGQVDGSKSSTALFPMQRDGVKITFADHTAGKFCFSCHNGEKSFAYTNCTNCHLKVPVPKAPIVYKPVGAAPVTFSHQFHTQFFECTKCHTSIWPMKKGAKKMTMDPMYEGKFCGVCHNDKEAFATTTCDKCHIELKK